MACWISMHMDSKVLKRPVELEILKPQYEQMGKVLFLLHGAKGSKNDWLLKTQIERFAEEHDVCVVMPNGLNSFFVNTKNSYYFMDYICKELPNLLKSYFHLSEKKEDWMIAGNSMGGYGALRCGLAHPKVFGWIASFSGVMDLAEAYDQQMVPDMHLTFGTREELLEKQNDLTYLIQQPMGITMPHLLLTCGKQDFLKEQNRRFYEMCKESLEIEYLEKDGGHDWYFWNDSIRCAMKWFCGSNHYREVF